MTAREKILVGMKLIIEGCETTDTECADCPFVEFCDKIDHVLSASEFFGNFLEYEVNKNG